MTFHNGFDDCQTQPGTLRPFDGIGSPVEFFEYPSLFFGWNPHPGILNLDDDLVALHGHADVDASFRGVYLMAFPIRLSSIWRIRMGLARSGFKSNAISTKSLMFFFRTWFSYISSEYFKMFSRWTISRRVSNPASRRPRSSSSLTRVVM